MSAPRDRSHDEVVVDMLKADPEIADVYLAYNRKKVVYRNAI